MNIVLGSSWADELMAIRKMQNRIISIWLIRLPTYSMKTCMVVAAYEDKKMKIRFHVYSR